MYPSLRFLLLQIRDHDDLMRTQEVGCFLRALGIAPSQLDVFDLLSAELDANTIDQADVIIVGGSGGYSATDDAPWLHRSLASLLRAFDSGKPLFASCWGFQAMARALGGAVETDEPPRAEMGTFDLRLTDVGRQDPVFAPLGSSFSAQLGHEDCVVRLPEGAILLASSTHVENQAYTFPDRPVYCTQFHPELQRSDLLQRAQAYPQYVERIAGVAFQTFCESVTETPAAEMLLTRFVSLHCADEKEPECTSPS
ncbi:MAG: type 1 glutamine amidotransferase [Planctomycetaceae bacterium]